MRPRHSRCARTQWSWRHVFFGIRRVTTGRSGDRRERDDGQVHLAIAVILDEVPFSSGTESKFKHPRERTMTMFGECGLLTRDGSFNGPKWAGGEFLLYEETETYEGEERVRGRWLRPVGSTDVVNLAL